MKQPAEHKNPELRPVSYRLIQSWPVGTFLENIAVLADGDFALSIHNQRRLLRIDRFGAFRELATLEVSPAGLIAFGDGVLAVAGEVGVSPHRVIQISLGGAVTEKLVVDGSLFLNGFTPAVRGRAYTVDSLRGEIIEVDVEHWTARVVLTDERLAKCSDEPLLPGANGIKAGDGCLYVTNTDRALILRAKLDEMGGIAALDVIADGLRGDDLALDEQGRIYITNHIHNTLIRTDADGANPVAIAGPAQGMAGSTACTFHPNDPGALYVTTTGGLIMPFEGVPQEAKLVRLDVGATGRPLPKLD